jgi:hypothetical protein
MDNTNNQQMNDEDREQILARASALLGITNRDAERQITEDVTTMALKAMAEKLSRIEKVLGIDQEQGTPQDQSMPIKPMNPSQSNANAQNDLINGLANASRQFSQNPNG